MGQRPDIRTERGKSPPQSSSSQADDFDKVVEALEPRSAHDRRERSRAAVSAEFYLTPLDADGNRHDQQTLVVVGRNISPSGIAFRHEQRPAERRAILSLEHPQIGRFEVEVEILWTRLAEPGWYESGATIVRTGEGHSIKTHSAAGADG